MAKKNETRDIEETRKILDELWNEVLSNPEAFDVDENIQSLVNHEGVAIRYCLPTQLLGKLVDPNLDCLCLQKGSGDNESLWDPRSFASKVIAPWVSENQSVLGTSSDPYVSKPLRKPRLESNPLNVKSTHLNAWNQLYKLLEDVQIKNSADYTRECMLKVLVCIHHQLSKLIFEYAVPRRISLRQTEILISTFLSESSGGDRGLSVAAALFETFGEFFGIYHEIKRHVINAADEATGLAGDIECIGADGNIKLVIEVKERNLTLADVRDTIRKARKVSIKELLFNAPGTAPVEDQEVENLFAKTWASGTNLYRLSIQELIRVGLSLTGEEGRNYFITKVGKNLDTYNTQPKNRKRWKELLEEM